MPRYMKSRPKRLPLKEMREIARERGGDCLSTEYINSRTKLKWICKEGHEWDAIPENIKKGHWCPFCAGRPIITIDDMHNLARERSGECLSTKYINAHTKLKWRCKEGHEWEATPDSIKRGSWCPPCIGRPIITIDDMHDLAKERGGECLSTKYINAHTKLRWRCSEGHEWEANQNNIKNGQWCPICGRFKASKSLRLTIKNMQETARQRGGECLSKEYINNHTKLRWKCRLGHEWEAIPNNIKRGQWCPICGRIKAGKARRLSIDDMRKIARERGGECLSKEYVNAKTKLKWRCKKGHEWEAAPNHVKGGSWCHYCAGFARLTIEEMQQIAKHRGGECLSTEYINNHTKLRWKCKLGHEWEATPGHIKSGRWCPYCAGRRKKWKMCVFFPGIRDAMYGDNNQIIGCIEHYGKRRRRRKKLCADCKGPD